MNHPPNPAPGPLGPHVQLGTLAPGPRHPASVSLNKAAALLAQAVRALSDGHPPNLEFVADLMDDAFASLTEAQTLIDPTVTRKDHTK